MLLNILIKQNAITNSKSHNHSHYNSFPLTQYSNSIFINETMFNYQAISTYVPTHVCAHIHFTHLHTYTYTYISVLESK